MREIIPIAFAALLTAAGVGVYAMSHAATAPIVAKAPVTWQDIAPMDPMGMMLQATDLPVHNIVDAI